ncbi:endoplasmic reticulum junction formation protein lunapark [Entomortierella parvispora]|uniref:Endoplasmic reticulum junction formation protein lunapark n=1 Tax=Entomortierella parvispora TaxID=205924 RepID=A0A9P3H4E2_9FUNG|nr:endoplasmic reticulum junction formation protein lunapark [Entomortierella parvispora]
MGAIISRLRKSDESDYEKILSDLDSNIRKAELRLSAINLREKRFMGLWLIYTVLTWIGYSAVFALYLNQQYNDEPQTWALAFAPVVIGLPVIYIGRSLITVWYRRAKTSEESQLSLLRADQRLKVEELKKKTAYYSTKTLLERYDPSSQQQRPNGQRPTGPDGRPMSAQNGQLRPQQPNMMDPGLRQRTGLGVTNAQGIPAGQGRPTGMAPGQQQPHPQHPLNAPRGPQGPYGPQGPHFNNGTPPQHSPNLERHWYDKIVDVIVGDEGPDTKYALICGQCFAHNGLALPQEIDDIQYVCPKCNFFNASRRKTRMGVSSIRPMTSPEMTLLQAQSRPLPDSRDPSPSPSHRSPEPDQHNHEDVPSHKGPGLADGSSPEPVRELVSAGSPINHDEHSENEDIEFVNNWQDSEGEEPQGQGQASDSNVETDEAEGYSVGPDDESESASKPKKSSTTSKAKSGGKKKATKRS